MLGSLPTSQGKAISSAVKGVPSCHFTPGRTLYVTSILPSGETCQVLLSTAGSSASRRGIAVPSEVMLARYWLTMCPSSRAPLPPPPLIPSQKFLGSSLMAATRILGAGGEALCPCDGEPVGAGVAGAQAVITSRKRPIGEIQRFISHLPTWPCRGPL